MTEGVEGSVADPAVPLHEEWAPGPVVRLTFDLILTAIGVGYLVIALQLEQWNSSGPRAGFFPVVAVTLFLVCMSIDTARAALRLRRHEPRALGRFNWKVAAVLGIILGYLLLVTVLGHILTAALVTVALLRLLGRRPWWQIILTALLAGVGSDLLFTELLGLRLTSGYFGIGISEWI